VIQTDAVSTKESKRALAEGNETVLVVDDEEALQELTEESLLDLGYQVLTAGNGQQALDVLTRKPMLT
jgi:CheY-like chemotaxis protein